MGAEPRAFRSAEGFAETVRAYRRDFLEYDDQAKLLPILVVAAGEPLSDAAIDAAVARIGSETVRISSLGGLELASFALETNDVAEAFRASIDADGGMKTALDSTEEDRSIAAQGAIESATRLLRASTEISLTQAGGSGDEDARLTDIFFDPGWEPWGGSNSASSDMNACAELVTLLDEPRLTKRVDGSAMRIVVTGGPGQGKSTMSHYLAQLYRAAFLGERTNDGSNEVRDAAESTRALAIQLKIGIPIHRRWPIQISLARYAEYIVKARRAMTKDGYRQEGRANESLMTYLTGLVDGRTEADFMERHLRKWLGEWPVLLILDGMDETAPELRADIREHIEDFEELAVGLEADLAIVITTRPQGAATDFPADQYGHYLLSELTPDEAARFGNAVARIHYHWDSDEARDLGTRVEAAVFAESRLAKTPLQVTILTLLIQQNEGGSGGRFQLFDGYFRVVYRRESGKAGVLGDFVRENRDVLTEVHERAALLLHAASEKTGDAWLEEKHLVRLILKVLKGRGYQADHQLAVRLHQAMVDRLVLLVSPRERRWEYEIRSIQEYMVARQWTSGRVPKRDLRKLLTKSAPLHFWRNVWALAAGRIFGDRVMYTDLMKSVLGTLDSADSIQLSVGPSARLAVDLLVDEVAAGHPVEARELLKTALTGLRDMNAREMPAFVDALAAMLESDRLAVTIVANYVTAVGMGWSLERVALTELLRELRDRTESWALKNESGSWLKTIGDLDDFLNISKLAESIELSVAVNAGLQAAGLAPVGSWGPGRFPWVDLRKDLRSGGGLLLNFSESVLPDVALFLDSHPATAELLAAAESSLRMPSPRMARQIREMLSYWSGRRPLELQLNELGDLESLSP